MFGLDAAEASVCAVRICSQTQHSRNAIVGLVRVQPSKEFSAAQFRELQVFSCTQRRRIATPLPHFCWLD